MSWEAVFSDNMFFYFFLCVCVFFKEYLFSFLFWCFFLHIFLVVGRFHFSLGVHWSRWSELPLVPYGC